MFDVLNLCKHKIKIYIKNKFAHFDFGDINPKPYLKEPITDFLAWCIPSIIFVVITTLYYPDIEFFRSAIGEGIGPNFWNLMGLLGYVGFALSILFLEVEWLAIATRNILMSTYSIGALSFGLLTGQLITADLSNSVWWVKGLFGVTSIFVMLILFLINFFLWYLAFLLRNTSDKKSTFLKKLEQMHLFWRFGIAGLTFILVNHVFSSLQ